MGVAFVRKSWATLGVGLGLVLCLSGCQQLFPRPVYTPPAPSGPAYPKPRAQIARPTFYVAVKDHLNLRACPGMDCPKISVLNRNDEVEQLGSAGDWSQVRVKTTGNIGWVYSRYLSANPLPTLPPVTAPATAPAPQVAPPPLPEIPGTVKPAPAKPPAMVKPPAKPEEGVPTEIKRKPEEARPAQPAPPQKVVTPAAAKPTKPEKPVKPEKPTQAEKPPKPAPAPAVEQPTPPAPEPTPEKPSSIRIM